MAMVLGIDPEKEDVAAPFRELVDVGLAEQLPFGYLRFDPALAPTLLGEMKPEERAAARAAWAKAVAAEIDFLYQQRFEDANLARNLCALDLANLVAALEHSAKAGTPERVVDLATSLEALVAPLNRPNALARAIAIRNAAAQRLGGWSHARFEAERSGVERLQEQGDYAGAVRAARALLRQADYGGEAAYPEAAYDIALIQLTLGRALEMSGAAEEGLAYIDEARRRFETLGRAGMANVALMEKADCLADLGRYDEAAGAYEAAFAAAEQQGNLRTAAVGKTQLATVRAQQGKYLNALALYSEVLPIYKQLGELTSVASVWHNIGIVHQQADQLDAAEHAYQESLKLKVQVRDELGEARTLSQLGSLYSRLGRREEAVRCYRQSAEVRVRLKDLLGEGLVRSNLANDLIKLERYDEARAELERAIECDKPFGHVAELWKTFEILSRLERTVGNEVAAENALAQAIELYRAYRRDGGAPQPGWEDWLS